MKKKLEYKECEITFSINDSMKMLRRFKQYTRNGKRFWRDYKKNVNGGITMFEFMRLRQIETMAYMIDNMATKVY